MGFLFQYAAFREPELRTFLKLLDKEESLAKDRIRQKYEQHRQWIRRRLEELISESTSSALRSSSDDPQQDTG